MATITGSAGSDSLTNGTSGADTIATGAGDDYVQASGGSDSYVLGYRSSAQYLRYGHGDFDTVDYRYVWNNLGLASATDVRIVADLQAGTVVKFGSAGTALGTDTLVGVDRLYGTQGNDVLRGRDSWGYEQFRGHGGNDTIDGRGGEDSASYSSAGVAGIRVALAAGKVTSTDPDVGTDTLREVENVVGTHLADTFDATGYSATSTNRNSFGGDWNVFSPLGGNDTIIGNGRTILNYGDVGGSITIDLSKLSAVAKADSIVKAFVEDANPNSYSAGSIVASGVNMVISGSGNDVLTGGGRVNDDGAGAANTVSGDVSYEQFRGQGGNDSISGGTGFDRADYRQGVAMVTGIEVRLAAGQVTGDAVAIGTDRLRGVESVRGTHLDDVYDATGFTLSNAASRSANNGDILATALPGETLASRALNEYIATGGNDTVVGNGATRVTFDVPAEGAGTSTLATFTSATSGHADYGLTDGGLGRVTFSGAFALRGGTGNDALTGAAGHQNLSGGFGNDTLAGGAGADILDGDTATSLGPVAGTPYTDDDRLDGGAGNDLLRGGAGKDVLLGGTGDDTVVGGAGKDALTGGTGKDVFAFLSADHSAPAAFDRILDFVRGADKVDLSGLDANAVKAGVQDFTFIKTAAFGANATGQLRYAVDAKDGSVMLYGSTDADAAAEFTVQLAGLSTLAASDILF